MVNKLSLLQELEKEGRLKRLVHAGIIPTTVLAHMEIALNYKALRKQGVGKMDSHHEISEMTGHTVQHVWRVVKSMTDVVG